MTNLQANIYVRVSTDEQAKYGYSLDSQTELCKNFAKNMGYTVSEVFIDGGISAKDMNRPAFQEMLSHCTKKKNNISAVIVWKLDRLCRNLNDYHSTILPMLFKHNVKLLSVTEGNDLETASGELARNIWMSFADYERKMIAQRVTAGMRAKAAKGIYPSKAPIGYKNMTDEAKNKFIVIDESRAFFVRKAFELYATGAYSVETLRKKLIEDGFNNGRTPITKKGVYTILKNPFYIGVIEWRGERFDNAVHKPLIKPYLFYKVQDVFERKANPRLQKHDFAYTSLIKCECGCFLTAEAHKGGRLVYYKCTGNKGCKIKKKYIREEIIEAKYQEIFDRFDLKPELAEQLCKDLKTVYKEHTSNDELSIEALSKEIPKLDKKLNQLYDDKLDGLIDVTFYSKKKHDYQAQIDKINIQIATKMKSGEEKFNFAQSLIELFKDAPRLFKQASPEKKRILVNLVQSNALLKDEKLQVELKSVFFELAKLADFDKWYSQGNSNPRRLREREVS